MPRPRAPSRDFFECTNRRRAGGKCDLYRCKRCGREMLENTHRFAIHISICKKATDEERRVAMGQLCKTKKYSSPRFNQPLPSLLRRDVDNINQKNKKLLMMPPASHHQQQHDQKRGPLSAASPDKDAESMLDKQQDQQHDLFASQELLLAFHQQCTTPPTHQKQPDWKTLTSSSATTHQHCPHHQHDDKVPLTDGIGTMFEEHLMSPLFSTQQQCQSASEELFRPDEMFRFAFGGSNNNNVINNTTTFLHLASNDGECFTDVDASDSFSDPSMTTVYSPSSIDADVYNRINLFVDDEGVLGFHGQQQQQQQQQQHVVSSRVVVAPTTTNATYCVFVHGGSNNGDDVGDNYARLAHNLEHQRYQSSQSYSSSSYQQPTHCYAWDFSSVF